VIYVVVGGLWMLLSDELLRVIIRDPAVLAPLEIVANWLYVVVTAGMLFALIRRNAAAMHRAMEELSQSEEQFRELAEHIQEIFWMSSPDMDHFIYVSPIYERIWGRSRESLYSDAHSWLAAVHPEDRDQVLAALHERAEGQHDTTYRIIRPDGVTRWVRDRTFPIRDQKGQTQRICGVIRDITEHVAAREQLEQRVEERTREIERGRAAAEALRDILGILNSEEPLERVLDFIAGRAGTLLDASAVAICIAGDGGPAVVKAASGWLRDSVKTAGLPVGQEILDQAMAERRPISLSGLRRMPGGSALQPARVTDDDAMLAVPLTVRGEVCGGLVAYYASAGQTSVEETKLVATLANQVALAMENNRLRGEVRQAAVAAERSRLAHDLHDSVTQALYSMMLYAEATNLAMQAGKQDVVSENLRELRAMAREAMYDMRALIFELHPPVLEQDGLVAALRARLSGVEARAGLQAEISVDGDERQLPLVIAEELFWIAQEALANAVKHARAQHIVVRLSCGQEVRMQVCDDGLGFDTAQVERDGHIGMSSIEERVRRIGGRLEITSAPAEGTVVTVEVAL
jgi:PAS domain S-box-containing protein